jgi:hypothetical protein
VTLFTEHYVLRNLKGHRSTTKNESGPVTLSIHWSLSVGPLVTKDQYFERLTFVSAIYVKLHDYNTAISKFTT